MEISTPARIHIDLIDMSGGLSRINGSVGFAVDHPRLHLRIAAAPELTIVGTEPDEYSYIRRELEYAASKLGLPDMNLRLEVLSSIPRHAGLGSGTQWQLALLALLGRFCDKQVSVEETAFYSTRGRTSGIGVHTFHNGGFIVDGGRRIESSRPAFKPSSFADPGKLPPLLFHSAFPSNWGVVVFIPDGFRGLSGEEERSFMERNTPIASEEVAQVCHSLLMEAMPAVVEMDLDSFCNSVTRLQNVGWKARHWGRSDLEGLKDVAESLVRLGIRGVGLSSTGPALFGFYCKTEFPDREHVRSRLVDGLRSVAPGDLYVTDGANQGANLTQRVRS
ncbi:beta-ribofuranosylaminobenzene 5'-phosphate synthase family protein [Rhodanobacter sp. C05]|uniref:beta-ribofuranosylaminobenzene 5'-phosphate synthase family protein n=1 Tax=Rhodanobacter sp. C05 TaxID=1945855 RepID=UPI0009CD4A43|nr:beta-ribofuranosylaminobenzene 5'-phosphate synthase family protein [Rhodanobacter sp. C05]OOG43465.1 hypothetical protein B0E51_01245 [Rhodanobacter sp. C05]